MSQLCLLGEPIWFVFQQFFVDNHTNRNGRKWNVLCWSIRGINSSYKWTTLRSKIMESNYEICCLQERKREYFDLAYIRNCCPASFDSFEYLSSIGASRGILVVWKSSKFSGNLIFQNNYALSIEFTSMA